MIQPKRLLVIGGKRKLLQRAKALGLEVVFVQKKAAFSPAVLPLVDQLFLLDYEDLRVLLPLVQALHAVQPFGYAISMTETGLLPAAEVAAALSLPGNSLETVRLLKDKWAMRQRLAERGVSPVAARLGQTVEDIRAFAQSCGLPIIVKPVDGAASYGILPIHTRADLAQVGEQLGDLKLHTFLMEEYLDGKEVSVESFSFAGRHVVLAITDKQTLPNHVEIGHAVPAPLDAEQQAAITVALNNFLDAVGLRDGPAHTELKLTERGPRIIESHNRVGGDKISDLVELACGVDMIGLTLAWAFGLAEALERPPVPSAGAAVRFFTPLPGRVCAINGVEAVRTCPELVELEINVGIGDRVAPVRQSADRVGHVLVRGTDMAEARATCERLAQQIEIVTTED